MAPRANWKGYLKLSLVSCAVELFPATNRSERIHFNIINRQTGNRVHYQVVDAVTGAEVPQEDRLKGFEVERDRYVLLEEQELDEVALESTHTIDIESFVPRAEVDELYIEEPYYLAPADKVGLDAFAVIRDAMRMKSVVGIARIVLHRREHILMLEPRGMGILAVALRFADEVRDARDYFDEIPDVEVSKEMLALAEHILDSKKTSFDPSKFEDRYETALKELISAKDAGKGPPRGSASRPSNVINLMDALRASVQSEGRKSPSRSTRASSANRPAPARRAGGKRKRLKRAS
jgi:DNA end-binding protein Ku